MLTLIISHCILPASSYLFHLFLTAEFLQIQAKMSFYILVKSEAQTENTP